MIKRAVRWSTAPHQVFYPYTIELEDGRYFAYYRSSTGGMWEKRDGDNCKHRFEEGWDHKSWEPCSPLEVIVICGTKGLE